MYVHVYIDTHTYYPRARARTRTIGTMGELSLTAQREIKGGKGGVTLALIVSRNFGPRDDSFPHERDKRARFARARGRNKERKKERRGGGRERGSKGRKKTKTKQIYFSSSGLLPARHRSFPFIQRAAYARPPKRARAAFPQRGIYNFDSFSLIARNSGIRINNCFCRKFYCVFPCLVLVLPSTRLPGGRGRRSTRPTRYTYIKANRIYG